MAIVNRDLDVTQARDVFSAAVAVVTGQTYPLAIVPYGGQLQAAEITAVGLSGAPNFSLWLQRFVVGSGVTSIAVGNSLAVTTFGTSGALGMSILGAASTFLLQSGDVLSLSVAGANTAATLVTVGLVVKCLQDVKTEYSV